MLIHFVRILFVLFFFGFEDWSHAGVQPPVELSLKMPPYHLISDVVPHSKLEHREDVAHWHLFLEIQQRIGDPLEVINIEHSHIVLVQIEIMHDFL